MSRSRSETIAATYLAPLLRRALTAVANAEMALFDALEAFSGYDEISAVVAAPAEPIKVPQSAA